MIMDAPGDIVEICRSLNTAGYSVRFNGFSALDRYLGLPALPFLWAETNADITVLARLMENLRFPGVEIADAAVDVPGETCYFRCLDREEQEENGGSFPLLSFGYDWQTRRFQDPLGLYPLLRTLLRKDTQKLRNSKRDSPKGKNFQKEREDTSPVDISWETALKQNTVSYNVTGRYRLIMDASLILSRYDLETAAPGYINTLSRALANTLPVSPPGPEMERAFLTCLMVSPRPERGLKFLKSSGFLKERWPELASYDDVDHSKEFHPEGNVWNHTLETFQHRKPGANGTFDLRLSLGLLLHDAGKPISASNGNHRFNGHAELGARAAAHFLERLEFKPALIQDIFYLVKNHMLPAALKRLPVTKTAEIMASPLFPTLMELYRCDESSSFKGLEGYYENSAAYRTYLRNVKNPYRSADGKKIGAGIRH